MSNPLTSSKTSKTVAVANDILSRTWRDGKRVLVVLGAGASKSAKVPLMTDVFKTLQADTVALKTRWENAPSAERLNPGPAKERLADLITWLTALAAGTAPRSIAAMALGTLQHAHEHVYSSSDQTRDYYLKLSDLWAKFSKDFIEHSLQGPKGEPIYAKMPTPLHQRVAEWVLKGHAHVVSLNFDGLTQKAVESSLQKGKMDRPVIINEPSEVAGFFLGSHSSETRLVPIVKVWGDVFHAICIDHQCSQRGKRVPIFEMAKSTSKGADRIACPVCGARRQLQIFFTGYEEKERSTEALMAELVRFVAAKIGCILTVGFSGLWDAPVVRFLEAIAADAQHELKRRPQLASGTSHTEILDERCWISVDLDPHPPLLQELATHNIAVLALTMTADEFAARTPPLVVEGARAEAIEEHRGSGRFKNEIMWHALVEQGQVNPPAAFRALDECQGDYLKSLQLLRQLGVKTKISRSVSGRKYDTAGNEEKDHNRRLHSFGAAHLALAWFRKLQNDVSLSQQERERLASVAIYAAVNHDIGHLPFTHLAEEVLAEVHWNLDDWAGPFHHDEPVLANAVPHLRSEIFDITDLGAGELRKTAGLEDCSGEVFRGWIEATIQGRSGHPWVDAIVNSPLDVDKLDYVFRDCRFLGQGIHLPVENNDLRLQWMRDLFEHSRVLPSGLLALEGIAGEHARDFLEERRWLYKNQYLKPAFRAFERLAGAIILQWLLANVPKALCENAYSLNNPIGDPSAEKGRKARELLWTELLKLNQKLDEDGKGEPDLLLELTRQLEEVPSERHQGLVSGARLREWAGQCRMVFESMLGFPEAVRSHGRKPTLEESLSRHATISECLYVGHRSLREVRARIRVLETERMCRALFDVAAFPRMLSYPKRHRFNLGHQEPVTECFAVADYDPDRWGRNTARWIPLSASAFAEDDKERCARIMAVSPFAEDPAVNQALDRLRNMLRGANIDFSEVDPDEHRGKKRK
jgi:hypothetical protein